MNRMYTLLLLCLATACSRPDGATVSGQVPDDSLASLLFTSANAGDGPLRLAGGQWTREVMGSQESVGLTEHIAHGDMDGDGDPDVAAVLVSSGGGTGVFSELAVFVNEGGRPVHAATAQLGDRVRVDGIRVDSTRIQVDLLSHAEEDPACCPTLQGIREFRFGDGQLVELSDAQ